MHNLSLEKIEDYAEFADFAAEIWKEYFIDIISVAQINYMLDKFQSKSAVKEQIKNDGYNYFYIVLDGQRVGYTGFSPKPEYLFLSKLYIKKEFRHKGIGTKAFESIKNFANEHSSGKIRLTVNKYNKNTIEAYKKWGFDIIDSIVTDIGSGFVMDDYFMEYKPE